VPLVDLLEFVDAARREALFLGLVEVVILSVVAALFHRGTVPQVVVRRKRQQTCAAALDASSQRRVHGRDAVQRLVEGVTWSRIGRQRRDGDIAGGALGRVENGDVAFEPIESETQQERDDQGAHG
jgi:hypothetical protein